MASTAQLPRPTLLVLLFAGAVTAATAQAPAPPPPPERPPAAAAAPKPAGEPQPAPERPPEPAAYTEEMVLIPAGPFKMGTPQTRERAPEDERPQHEVTLDAFRIDRYEVTNAQYTKFLDAVREKHPPTCNSQEPEGKDHTPDPRWWDDPEWNAPEKPVVGVDWFDAYAYCAWAGKRLPTEAQWEKAARGTDGRIYPWGNAPPNSARLGNFADESARKLNPKWRVLRGYDDGFAHTAPVGSFPAGASPYGAQDMVGNVWEWVNDWYDAKAYTEAPQDNPTGPAEGEFHVVRGGSFDSTPNFIRVAVRYRQHPTYRHNSYGFRCARDVAD